MIVLDTTVLVYAVGTDHPLRAPCLRLLDGVRGRQVEATTTIEVVQEFVHVRAQRRTRQDAAALGRDFARLLAPLLAPTASDLIDGLGIFESQPTLGCFDSTLAATCLSRSGKLVSADIAFANVPGLVHLVPGTPQLDALLE